jgi:polyisoprenoid-binding protein YceI
LLSNGSWSVDPAHSTVEFQVKHMTPSTDGSATSRE